MAQPLLHALVSGTRQVLAVQLVICIAAVALAGWTLAVTNEVMRERDRLRERVVQLEGALAERGVVVPPAPTVVSRAPLQPEGYPDSIAGRSPATTAGSTASGFDPRGVFDDIFAPPPPWRTLVLHVRSNDDAERARRIAEALSDEPDLLIITSVTSRAQPSSYIYYDGRQSRAAAALVARFNDAARRADVPQWSAQPRALALPATGEFTADRLDIVLTALPTPPAPAPASAAAAPVTP